ASHLGHPGTLISPSPALVLDDIRVTDRDFSKYAMGRVKDFNYIPNLQFILADDGFEEVKVFYLGVKGKVFMVRAKESFTWNPSFLPRKEKAYSSDDESVCGDKEKELQSHLSVEEEGETNTSDIDGVAETIFGNSSDSPKKHNDATSDQHSEDPFELTSC
nr:RNA-directed DNA polymerase, eukaryota [Tanacetum cinerariifolium]